MYGVAKSKSILREDKMQNVLILYALVFSIYNIKLSRRR